MEIVRLCVVAICGYFTHWHTGRHLHGTHRSATFRVHLNALAFTVAASFRGYVVFPGQILHSKEPAVRLTKWLTTFRPNTEQMRANTLDSYMTTKRGPTLGCTGRRAKSRASPVILSVDPQHNLRHGHNRGLPSAGGEDVTNNMMSIT